MVNSGKIILGRIYTGKIDKKWAEAVLVEGNTIKAVGRKEDILNKHDKDILLINTRGRLILPGFIDCHVHFMMGGALLNSIDFSNSKSKQEFIGQVENYIRINKSEWILGGNWDHMRFEDKQLPNRDWIDSITSEIPLFVTRLDIHMALANSKALELAGINEQTPDPPGGRILRDSSSGKPTGILVDSAMKLVQDLIPKRDVKTLESDLKSALDYAARNGVTSVHDISDVDSLGIYLKFLKEKKLTCRINASFNVSEMDLIKNYYGNETYQDSILKIKAVKAFTDGSLGSHTAWFHEPYSDNPATNGLPTAEMVNGELSKLLTDADKRNYQLLVHAIGDKAVSELIDIYDSIVKENGVKDRRLRIEHLQHMKRKEIERLKRLDIIASMQPSHMYEDCCWCEELIGKARVPEAYTISTLFENGIKVCFGSDWTVADLNPLHGIYSAVTRQTKDGRNPEGWCPEEKISVEQAVTAYTNNAAYASFEENLKGSIEEGKLADLIVLR